MTQAFNLSQFANFLNTSGQLSLTSSGITGSLGIANGGTNNGSLAVTAGGILYTDGTKFVNVGAGTSGQLLQSGGAGAPSWVAAPTGGFSNMQVFTSPGTFTTPASTTRIKITIVGGGGGSSGGRWTPSPLGTARYPGNAGGGGGYAELNTPVTSSTPYSVTVGAGGTAGGSDGNGGSGGTSSFGVLVSATGGTGGISTPYPSNNTGSGGSSTGGQISIPGQPGQISGNSQMGWCGIGIVGQGYGGSGGTPSNPSPTTGWAGAAGVVIVEY